MRTNFINTVYPKYTEKVIHLTPKIYIIRMWIKASEETGSFNVYGSVHHKNILIYVQQDATLHSLFYLKTAVHVSGGGTTRNM